MIQNFISGPVRVLACEEVIADLVECIGDIIVLDEEERMYNVRPGIIDIGASRTGIRIDQNYPGKYGFDSLDDHMIYTGCVNTIQTQLAELHPETIWSRWHDEYPLSTIIFLMQRPDKKLRAYVFRNAKMLPMDMNVSWRGEMDTPVRWQFEKGWIMEEAYD